jgi:RNA polymerase sigma-70 factor (ECF subfamily)
VSNSDANTERFVELLGAHERELIAYVYALTMNWNDAQEIMQRVRIRLWQQFDSYDEAKPFGAWARAVSYYLVLAFRKEKSRQREYFAEAVLELVSETYERGVDQAVQRREALMKCLDKLSAEQRGVVDRCYANNEKIVDVAQQMGITSGALRQSLFRIRKSLQDCVQRFARSS